ncbi:MAG: hypothetical protein AAF702_45965 [Chloroflexota bacterium]
MTQPKQRLISIFCILLILALMPSSTVRATQDNPQVPLACEEGVQSSGALYQICVPDANWNGSLIIWSHGYVAPALPLAIQNTFGSISLPDTLGLLGYAFATTSFSKNGLAIRQGVDDLVDLVAIFDEKNGTPALTYLMGVSLGAATSTLALEKYPDKFSGGLSMCGPYGNFQEQLDYFTNTRVLFDHFFPDVLPSSPIDIPESLIADWTNVSNTTVVPVLASPGNITQTNQLLATSQVAFDTQVPTTTVEALVSVLSFNVLGSNDGVVTLGGQPFDNRDSTYVGSLNDEELNQFITRFAASQIALDEVAQHYETGGRIDVPLVTMHTTGDPIVPYWHATQYQTKIDGASRGSLYMHQSFERYGHCRFTQEEIVGALTVLNQLVASNITVNDVFIPLMLQ